MTIRHQIRCDVLAAIADVPLTSEQLSRRLQHKLTVIQTAVRDLKMEGIIEETIAGWDYAQGG